MLRPILLETDRLRLRPLGLGDVDALHRLWTTPGGRQYLWDGEVIPREQTEDVIRRSCELFEKSGLGLWAVLPRDGEDLIGYCGYWFFRDPPELEILYGIAEEQWGRGLAAEAVRAMIRYGFDSLGFERIVASTDAGNVASVRVMEKLGMRFERRATIDGLDTIFYAITPHGFTLSPELKELLEERLLEARTSSEPGITWEEMKARLLNRP